MGLIELYSNVSYFNYSLSHFFSFNIRDSMQNALYYKQLENELYGKHLNIATMQNGALSSAIKVNNTWIGKGIAFELIQLLQDLYKFEYSVTVPLENSLGSKDDGVFGLIYKKKVDLAAAFLPMTTIYWKYANFATCLDMGNWIGILKRPDESGAGLGIFAPFATNVWILIMVSIFVIGVIAFTFLYLNSTFSGQTKKISSFQDCLLFAYSTLLKQSSTLKPRFDSSRCVFTAWWLFIMLITAFYTANLTAFLTLSETKLPIKKTRDIVTKKYSIVGKTGTVIEEITANDPNNVFKTSKKVYVKEEDVFILNKWIREQNFIYIAEKPNIDIVLYKNYLKYINTDTSQKERCAFVATSWSIYEWPRSFVYSKTFKFGPLFDRALRRLVEIGLVKHNFNKYLPVTNYCPLNLHSQERSLSNANFLITYYILISGFLLSLCVFILENAFFILKKKFQEEVEQLNEVAQQKPHSQLIANIQKENRHLREIQQENRELRAALEEHQSALEHIMSKYRQHTAEQIYKSRINFLTLQDHNYNDIITKQAEKIQEMAAVMDYAAFLDESQANKDDEVLSKLKTENQGLRELLEISCKFGSYEKGGNGPTTMDKVVQTDFSNT
ncbi:hypothetical protein RN001_003216 [Aquatica leii]|uniref:Ionotropic glutamate receptor C-terminal domain-containing protein n=1 Tax=Aquatica leii TaxID=1421715 RepID=A0AAN7PEN1_9COLE|nr:hypothetical protein RN001_003216 [Aquatica leii]